MNRLTLWLSTVLVIACSGAQKQAERTAVTCGAAEVATTIGILDTPSCPQPAGVVCTNGAQKLLALAAVAEQTKACVDASKPPASVAK